MSLAPRFDEQTERLLREARIELARLEEENQRVRAELRLVQSSRAWQALRRLRSHASRASLPVRHPFWTLRAALRRLQATALFRFVRTIVRQLARHSISLSRFPMVERESGQEEPERAIRWIGAVSVAGERREALFCHGDTTVTIRTTAVSGSRIRTGVALHPDTWAVNKGGAEFSIVATSEGWIRQARVLTEPGRRWRDRRWLPLSLQVPTDAGGEITLTLTTRFVAGAGAGSAWALWGDPRIEWPRSGSDRWRLVRAFLSRLRIGGLRDALTHIQRHRESESRAAEYVNWLEAHAPDAAALAALKDRVARLAWQPLISVIVPVHNTPPHLLSACLESVRRQVYPHWELCIADDGSTSEETAAALRAFLEDRRVRVTRLSSPGHISAASNAALALASGEFVAFLDHDDELCPDALAEVVDYLNAHPDADLVYTDEDKLDAAGARCDPAFKPDWSPELLLSCMYICHLLVVRRSVVNEVGGFRTGYEGAQDYDLALRIVERTRRIHHVPKVLYHWRKAEGSTAGAGLAKPWALDAGKRALEDYARRNGIDAEVLPGGAPGLYRLRRQVRGEPLVTLVIPTTGSPRNERGRKNDLLLRCLESVRAKTAWPHYEIVLVIDEDPRPPILDALRGATHQIVRYTPTVPFNFSHKVNEGVRHAQGAHVVLFNDDLEVVSPEWLSAMLEYSQEPEVGAVGARLLYPDGRLQHVGMLLGVAGIAAHAYHQYPNIPGYMSANICVRNCSAVTGACMMVRREVWDEMGGFNEAFAVDFNDVDFCLRLRRAGYRIVYTPYAELRHHESASFGTRTQSPREAAAMRKAWGEALERDPYYNPNLSRWSPDYRIGR